MLGTLVDAYYRGYDCITVEDCIATTSPVGGLENVLYNAGRVSSSSKDHAFHYAAADSISRATGLSQAQSGSLKRLLE